MKTKYCCEYCGTGFQAYPCQRKLKHIYCSIKCTALARNQRYTKYLFSLNGKLRCHSCGEIKSKQEFSINRNVTRGRSYRCLLCERKHRKEYLEKNPHIRLRRNATRQLSYQDPEVRKTQMNTRYNARYGITLDEYNEWSKKQNHRCKICGVLAEHTWHKRLHIDHDHKTGKLRGLLCPRCNWGISHIEDKEWIIKAQKYLLDTKQG